MKKRKNKFVPLIVLVVLLAALMIGYSALSAANDRKEAELAAEEAAENAVTMIAEYDYSTTAKLSYKIGEGDFLTFTQSAGVWSYADDANFPLNQTIITQMAAAVASIGVETTVEEGTEADYGLDNPAYTIKVEYTGGSTHTYKIGDYNSFNGAYYFSMDREMYMVSSALLSYFQYELTDLLALDTIPTTDWADNNYVSEITVADGEKSNTIADDAGKTGVLAKIGALSLTNCADYYADADEKNTYGLDGSTFAAVKYKKAVTSTDDSGKESTTYLETTYTIHIGAAVGHNEGYYISPAKSNIVYIADETSVLELLAYTDYAPAETEAE